MAGGIWEAIGAALQAGGQTYNQVAQQKLLQQQELAGLKLRQDAAAREAHYQDIQLRRQAEEDQEKDEDRKRAILQYAIEHANPGEALSNGEDLFKQAGPLGLQSLFDVKPGNLSSRNISGMLTPGGVTQHTPNGTSVTEGNGPVADTLKMGPLTGATGPTYSIKGTPAQRMQAAQANAVEGLLNGGGMTVNAPNAPGGIADTPRNRVALSLIPGVSANEVLGPKQQNPFDGQVTGPDVLKNLSPQEALLVQKMANYELPIPGGNMRSPQMQHLLGLAAAYDPSFDATQYSTRQTLRKDFTSGKAAQNVRSLNTVISHLAKLREKADALNNFGSPSLNAPVNWFESNLMGDERVTGFNSAAHAVESEAAALFKGMGATDQEIKAWRSTLSPNMSPDQLHESMGTMVDLLKGRMDALKGQYEKGMGKPTDFELLNPSSKKILESFGIGSEQPSNMTPEGAPAINVAENPMGQQAQPSGRTASVAQVTAFARAKGVAPAVMANQLRREGWTISGQ